MIKHLAILLIVISAVLWGTIAIFVRKLANYGFTPMEIVTLRAATAALLLGIIGFGRYRSQLLVRFRDLPLFIGTGIFSIVLFNWSYFTAIKQMNLSIAVILLYTAPAFVAVMSYLVLKEKMTRVKLASLGGTIIGITFIAGLTVNQTASISAAGILTGLGAGFGYALYSIFGKFALKKYPPFTVTLYTFITAAAALIPVTGLWKKGGILADKEVLLYIFGLGFFPTVIAYLLYTKGLETVDSSKASIVATVEPVVATLLSVFLYNEGFGVMQGIGSAMILFSVLLINLPVRMKLKMINRKSSI